MTIKEAIKIFGQRDGIKLYKLLNSKCQTICSLIVQNFKLTTGASNGALLVSDANGAATWQPLSNILNSDSLNTLAWRLTGNSGTNTANDFIGTTDNQPLVFRTNNVERFRILENGNVGIGTISPIVPIHIYNTSLAAFIVDSDARWLRFSAGSTGTAMKFSNQGSFSIGAVSSRTDNTIVSDFIIHGSTRNIGINTPTDAGFRLDVNGNLRASISTSGLVTPYQFVHTLENAVGWNQGASLSITRNYLSSTVYQANGILRVVESGMTAGWSLGSYFQGRGHVIRVINIGTTGANLAGGYNHSCISLEAINGTGILGVFTPSSQGLYNNAFALFQNVANRAEGGRIYLGKNRGTGTAATLIQTNDEYGAISFGTDTSTNGGVFGVAGANIAAEILSRATAAPSGTSVSSNLIFRIKNNSTTFTDAVTINSTGNVLIGTTTDNASAILNLTSTTKGFLPPRMTSAERTAIASPAVGLIVYQTDGTEGLYVNSSTGWIML